MAKNLYEKHVEIMKFSPIDNNIFRSLMYYLREKTIDNGNELK